MSDAIIGMHDWFETPPGRYLLAWERTEFDRAVSDIFGYHALQLGLPELDTLQCNRMPHRWLALQSPPAGPPQPLPAQASISPTTVNRPSSRPVALLTEASALPFPESSLDLVV